MNKFLIYCLVFVALLASCRKDDTSVFNQSPDERINATLAKYQTQLSGAQNGWKAIIYPAGGGAYSFYFKFNDLNRVSMYSDFDTSTAVTLKESSYRLKALQQPSLIFDTYTYVHLLADPNEYIGVVANVNGGPSGVGLKSDYEFYFDATTTDTIKLVGRYNGSKATLVRATAAEATAYTSGQLAAGFFLNRIQTYFKRLTIGTQILDVKLSPDTHSITLSYVDATGTLRTFTTGYYLVPGGVVFVNPLVVGNTTITGFNNMQWVATTQSINLTVGNTASTIAGVVVPVRVDLTAPKRWRDYAIANSGVWISANGFHVNGADDGYNVKSLVQGTYKYDLLLYFPAYDPSYDLLAPFLYDQAQNDYSLFYGSAPRVPTYTIDGRAIFREQTVLGSHPTSGPAALTRAKLYDASGYYFVQTGDNTFDMVGASDGRAWVSWEFSL